MIANRRTALRALACCAALLLAPLPASAAKVDQVVTEGEQRTAEGAASQQKIDRLSDTADKLLRDYRQVVKVIDGLQVYNGLLQKQVDGQVVEMEQLRDSMAQVALIERQIVPLMVRMIDGLDEFIGLDVPFLLDERRTRVARLQAMLERADVDAAEKFRKVLEAYEIENDYGRTIEAYKGSLEVAGKAREVDFLRVGRVGLYYQTVGGAHSGAWDQAQHQWVELPADQYKSALAAGLRIARKQVAPDLLTLPVAAPQEVRR
jgi:hypothetical protein